jgi:hypothetical protein
MTERAVASVELGAVGATLLAGKLIDAALSRLLSS